MAGKHIKLSKKLKKEPGFFPLILNKMRMVSRDISHIRASMINKGNINQVKTGLTNYLLKDPGKVFFYGYVYLSY
jgi:hypothetical protein